MSDATAERQRSVTDLPKAHLHLHFTGSMRVETVRDLAARHGIRLPSSLTTDWPPRFDTAGRFSSSQPPSGRLRSLPGPIQ